MTYAATVLADSPLVYWRFGDASGTVAADSSGNSRDGAYGNGPTLGAAGLLTGDSDTAVTFNGSNQFANIAGASWMNTADYSIECWFKTGALAAQRVLVSRDDGATKIWDVLLSTSGNVQMNIFNGPTAQTVTSPAAYADNVIHHVVCTLSGTTATVYVDGVQVGQGTGIASNSSTTQQISVARRNNGTLFYDGTVDEFAYYGTALSSSRVAAHHTAGTTSGPSTEHATPTLNAVATLSATARVTRHASPSLTASASLSSAPAVAKHAAPTLTAVATMDSAPVTGATAAPTLSAATTLGTATLRTVNPAPTLAAAATLDTTTVADHRPAVTLAALATLDSTAALPPAFAPSLLAIATLAAGLSRPSRFTFGGLDLDGSNTATARTGTATFDFGGILSEPVVDGDVDVSATEPNTVPISKGWAAHATRRGVEVLGMGPGARLALYDTDGTWMTGLPKVTGLTWQEVLNDTGTISFQLPLTDADTAKVTGQRVVKALFNGRPRFAARVDQSTTETAVDGTGWRKWDSLPGIAALTAEAVIFPEYGLRTTGSTQRYFGFMSKRSKVWYDPSQWKQPHTLAVTDDTGFRKGAPGGFAKLTPVPQWIGYDDVYTVEPAHWQWIYRREFSTYRDNIDYQLIGAADDHANIWVDGELVWSRDQSEHQSFRYLISVTGTLPAGPHIICVRLGNSPVDRPNNAMGLVLALQEIKKDGTPVKGPAMLVTDRHWKVGLGADSLVDESLRPPAADVITSWHRGEVLGTLWREAIARSVRGFRVIGGRHFLQRSWTGDRDSDGAEWTDHQYGNHILDVGQPVLDVHRQFAEDGVDFTVDYGSLTVNAYKRAGVNRSGSVVLQLGKDGGALLSNEVTRVEPGPNSGIMQMADGTWSIHEDDASVTAYGRAEVGLSLGSTDAPDAAEIAADAQFNETAHPTRSFSVKHSTLDGPQPYKHYFIGDEITAPDEDSTGTVKARVTKITVDASGDVLQAWPDLEEDRT